MAEITYLDFDIEIGPAAQGYRVAVNSPAGQSAAAFQPPFSDLEIENFLLKLGQGRRTMRRIDAPATEAAKAFGARLFEATFAGDTRACLRSSLDEADRQGKGLRLRLRLNDAPELADLPWEFLYYPAVNRFLALSIETPLVRYLELPERIRPLAIAPPLRVLTLIASPRDQPPIDAEREWRRLNEALATLQQRGLVQVDRVEQPSLAALQRQLRRNDYHILHFIGHGGFDEHIRDGVLLLEDDDRLGHRISGQNLGMLLHDHRSLRLVVLNACEGARGSRTDPFAGSAQSLVQQGIPAVIAMQFEVSDEAAITLAREFYGALADGYPLDAGLAEARKALFAASSGAEWATPVLYLRAPDGRIFDISAAPQPLNGRQSLVATPNVTDERLLEAALPDEVVVRQTIELVALIRRHGSAGLRELLQSPLSNFEAQPDDVRAQPFDLEFPRDERGRPVPIELTIAIESTDFQTPTPQQKIRLEPDADTEPIIFLLTPLHSGELRLLLHVYLNRDLLLASGFLKVSGVAQLAEGFHPLKRLISMSLGTFGIGRTTEPPRPVGLPPAPHGDVLPAAHLPDPAPPPPPAPEQQAEEPAKRATRRLPSVAPLLAALVVLIGVGLAYGQIFGARHQSGSEVTSVPAAGATTLATNTPAEALSYAGWAEIRAPLNTISTTEQLNTVAVSPDGTLLAAGGLANVVHIWDLARLKPLRDLTQSAQPDDTVNKLAFSPDGALLASVSSGYDLLLWNVRDGTLARRLHGADPHAGIILSVAFSPDGALIASGASDQTIKLWRVADGALLRTLRGHTNAVNSVAFSPDSAALLSGAFEDTGGPSDTRVRLWRVSDGALLRTFDGATGGITSVAFSHDGTKVAAGSWDENGYVWRAADGKLLGKLAGNLVNGVRDLAFSPDDSAIATAGGDSYLRLFSTADLRQICALQAPNLQTYQGWLTGVAFTPNGRHVITSSYDLTIRIWGILP